MIVAVLGFALHFNRSGLLALIPFALEPVRSQMRLLSQAKR